MSLIMFDFSWFPYGFHMVSTWFPYGSILFRGNYKNRHLPRKWNASERETSGENDDTCRKMQSPPAVVIELPPSETLGF